MIPKEVFHYTTTSIALDKILFEKKLKIGQLKNTNDPKESGEYSFDTFVNAPWDIPPWKEKLRQIATPIKINEWKILSVSINHPDLESEQGLINPLLFGGYRPRMWAHYGENHKGVCLKLNGNKLDEQIKKSLLDTKCEIFSGEVDCDDRWVNDGTSELIDFDDISKLNDIELKEWIREYFKKNHEKIFLTKSKEWESEHEFRWLVHNEKDSPEFIPIDDIVEEIFVGCDFHKTYYPSLYKLCKDLGIPAYEIFWNNGKPGRKKIDFDK